MPQQHATSARLRQPPPPRAEDRSQPPSWLARGRQTHAARRPASPGASRRPTSSRPDHARPLRTASTSPAPNRTNTSGVANANWPPINSPRCCSAACGCQSPVRPPCLTKLIHPCCPFQITTGRNNANPIHPAGPRPGPAQMGPDGRGPCEPRREPTAHSTAVYLLSIASPVLSPAKSHQRPSVCTRTSRPKRERDKEDGAACPGSSSPPRRPTSTSHSAVRPRLPRPAAGKEPVGRVRQQHRAEPRRQRPEQTHAERRVAGQDSARSDQSATIGGVIQVSRGERPRPDPIIGLVRRKRRARRDQEPDHGQRQEQRDRQRIVRCAGLGAPSNNAGTISMKRC